MSGRETWQLSPAMGGCGLVCLFVSWGVNGQYVSFYFQYLFHLSCLVLTCLRRVGYDYCYLTAATITCDCQGDWSCFMRACWASSL